MSSYKAIIKSTLRLLLTLSLIILLVNNRAFNIEQLKVALASAEVLLFGIFIFSAQAVLFAIRWRQFVSVHTRVPFGVILKLHMIGLFFNFFVPGGVGGDVLKCLGISKYSNSSGSHAFLSVFSDRVFALYNLILLSFCFPAVYSLIHGPPSESAPLYIKISGLLFVFSTVFLLFIPKFLKKLERHRIFFLKKKWADSVSEVAGNLSAVTEYVRWPLQLKNFCYNFILLLSSSYFIFITMNVSGFPFSDLFLFFSLCCIGFLVSAIPIFPAGVGVGQLIFYNMFSVYGSQIGQSAIIAISMLQLFNFAFAVIGGLIFVVTPSEGGHQKSTLDSL